MKVKRRIARHKGRCETTKKVRYRDEASARRVVRAAAKRRGDERVPVRWYQCQFCHDWHTTSQERKP